MVSHNDYRSGTPAADCYSALFLLFVQYAAPSGTFDEQTFAAVKAQEEKATGFAWPKISWIFVFQYPIVMTLCLIIEESTLVTGHYCENSLSPKFAHIWVQIFSSISIGACVLAILRFRGHMKGLMSTKRGLSKIVLFKAVVGVRFLQQWIFSILLTNHDIKTSKEFEYNDIFWGIPAVLTCAEMVLFSAAFWYAFSPSEYSSTAHREKAMPIWKAIPHALNPADLIMGMIRIFPLLLHVRESGDLGQWQAARRQQGAGGAIRKGIRSYQNRRGQRAEQYEEIPSGRQSPYKPADSYHMRNMSSGSYGDAGAAGRLSASNVYQPPSGSPPDGMRTHLMAEAQPPSQDGMWNGQGYEPYGRSRTPSPGRT